VVAISDVTEQAEAADALRRSEAQFRTLIDAMSDGTWTADTEGRIASISAALARRSDTTVADAEAVSLGDRWFSAVHPDDLARVASVWQACVSAGQPYSATFRVERTPTLPGVGEGAESAARHGGSIYRWVRVNAVPMKNEDGTVREWIGALTDIDEQMSAEEAIRLSEMRLREAQRLTKSGSWHWDAATERVTWSEELFHLFGLDPAAGIPPIAEILARFLPEDRERLDRAFDAAEYQGEPFAADFHLIDARNEMRCFHVIGRSERDAAGNVAALFGTAVDITARKEMEEELRRTQTLARRISLAMPDLLYVYDLELDRTVYTNREIVAHLGYGPEDAEMGDGVPALSSLVHPDDLPRLERIQERLRRARDGQVVETTFRQRHKDGSWRWLHCREMVFTRGADGHPSEILGVAQDITERKEAQDRLKESEERYRSLVGLLSDWVWECDTDGAFTSVSPQVTSSLGYLPDEMVSLHPVDFVHLDDRARVKELLGSVVRRHAPFAGQVVRFVSLLGETVYMEVSGVPLADASGAWIGYRGVGRDITRRKLAEDQLRNREEHLTRLIASSPDSIKTLDLDGRLLSMNEAGRILMEISDLMPLRERPWVETWPVAGRERVACALAEARAGRTARFEGFLPTATGTPKWWDVVVTPLLGPDGLPEQLLAVSRDITAQKSLEEQKDALLADAIERAERDPLTGLFDHRAFHNQLEEAAARAMNDGTRFAVALVDVDNFKYFNDVFGHLEGDGVLLHVAEALRASCRQDDVIGRLGGDEFAILMPGVAPGDAEALLVDRFQTSTIVTDWQPRGHDSVVPLRLSFGAAVFPDEKQNTRDLLKLADERLYHNKKAGNEGILEPLREELTALMVGFPMLDALVMAVDGKDRYTKRHSEDVLIYAVMIAQEIGMAEEDLLLLRAAALLHDVGKIGVSANILRLPTKLSDEEYEAVKRHAALGAALIEVLLRGRPEWQPTIVDAVRHHHEAWDGQGYPDGLAGEQIPLMARILAVADAFSALTTDRPYRKGMPPGKALSVLEAGAGSQWDSDCVAAFLRVSSPYRDLDNAGDLPTARATRAVRPHPLDPARDSATPSDRPDHPGDELRQAA
jgi:diguanylate cyclase (GGDEF)-like protein/PAS domain S-box-containing protein